MRKTMNIFGGAVASAAFLASCLASTATFATDPTTQSLTISGTVSAITYMPFPPTTSGTPTNASLNGTTVAITQLADAQARLRDASITIRYSDVTTNYPAKIALFSANKGLRSGTAIVPYTAQASTENLNTGECVFNGGVTPCVSPAPGFLSSETIDVEITTTAAAGEVLAAGTYTDTLTLKVGSNP